ncbi:MAG: hypothetical protein KF777_09705 [Planctomycetaceae bacterium]|nr:hypothetical protein [Planctomycetaceae bacterium]
MAIGLGIPLVLLGVILLVVVIAALVWAIGSGPRVKSAAGVVGALIGLPLLTFGTFFWTARGQVLVEAPRYESPDVEVVELGSKRPRNVDHAVVLAATEDRTSSPADHPKWLQNGETETDGTRTVVISSRQYATTAEAERELTAIAGNEALQDWASHSPYAVPYGDIAAPNREQLGPLVTRTYVEKVDRDFGSFYAPMYRLWWELTFSPETRGHLEPVLLDQVRGQRQTVVSIGLAILAALGGAVWTLTSFLPTTKP